MCNWTLFSEEYFSISRKRKRPVFEEELSREEEEELSEREEELSESGEEDGDSNDSDSDPDLEKESDWEEIDKERDLRDPDDAEQQAKKKRQLILLAKQQLLKCKQEVPKLLILDLLRTLPGREALRALDNFGINYKTAILYLRP